MSNRRRDTLPKSQKSAASGPASQRRVSRREREARQRMQLYIGLAIAAVLSVVIVTGFALNEYWFKPRTVLASVNGVEIRRRDYWKVRSVDLVNQVNQYQQFAQLVDSSQQQQYITLAQQAATELDEVWGSTGIDDATLTRMVEDQVYLQSLSTLNIEITDQDVKNYIDTQFQPANAPLATPTPSPTLIPQRAEWATETEIALRAEEEEPTETSEAGSPISGSPIVDASPISNASPIASSPTVEASPEAGSPTVAASPVAGSPESVGSPTVPATPIAESPVAQVSPTSVLGSPVVQVSPSVAASPVTGSPDASPEVVVPRASRTPLSFTPVPYSTRTAEPTSTIEILVASPASGSPVSASPVTDASPEASPIVASTSTEAPTPNPTQAIETAEAGYKEYRDVVFDVAHLSESDYERLVVRPALAREKVDAYLLQDVGQSAPQVLASHILVDTKDLADSIYAQLQGGADFAQTAKDQSNDTTTAENGGDLGWFAKGQMVETFENVAFGMQPGQISEPFQTGFGWHIVKVYETNPDRGLTDQQITQYKDSIIARWLESEQESMEITSKVEPTPTPVISAFVPPPDAPLPPTATAVPEASPIAEGSPVASPVSDGSPVASPIMVGTPGASPIASPAT